LKQARGSRRPFAASALLPPRQTGRSQRFLARLAAGTVDEMFLTEAEGDAYLALGVSTCFRRDEDGKLSEVSVIEPINATTLETMNIGAATSFQMVTGVTLADVVGQSDKSYLPAEYREAEFCEDFEHRSEICARTWLRPYPQEQLMDIVPLGATKTDWNFDCTKHKRVLNLVHEVTDEDNIKQDKSIDVYGRFDEEEEGK